MQVRTLSSAVRIFEITGNRVAAAIVAEFIDEARAEEGGTPTRRTVAAQGITGRAPYLWVKCQTPFQSPGGGFARNAAMRSR